MTTLPDWLSAARADAVAAQRADGWLTVPELERAGHDPHDTDHIARFSPDVALLVLGVVEAAARWRAQCMTIPHDEWVEGEYATECELIAAIDALRAHVEGAGE